jgi:uncharacterized protein YmfQ (DUF2313 family)
MIVVNLQQIGPCAPRFCEPAELAVIYTIAQDIMAATDPDTLADILAEWETALCWRSLEEPAVGDEWYYRALLLTCCRGLRGEMTPVFYTISQRD